jgi:hypothetical protein
MMKMNIVYSVILSLSLCSFVMLHQDVVHLHLRFYCTRGRVLGVSIWNNTDEYNEDKIMLFSFSHCVLL